MIFKFDPMLL